jgi:hypothetical protein
VPGGKFLQFDLLNINPADVVSLRPAPVIPETIEFSDLTHCVEFDVEKGGQSSQESKAQRLAFCLCLQLAAEKSENKACKKETTIL